MREVFKKVLVEDLISTLSLIRHPTLILWGREDKLTPVADAYVLNKGIVKSKLQIFDNEGHKLPYLRQKDIAETIDKWATNLS